MRLLARILLISVPLWTAYIVLSFPLYIFGVPLIWLASGATEVRPSKYFPGRMLLQFRNRAMWLWGNFEDGIDGLRGGDEAQYWWADRTHGNSERLRIFKWSALRNPVGNLRFIPFVNPRISSSRIRFVGMDHEPEDGEGGWYYCWQGPYSCIRYETKHFRFWLGHKLKPTDQLGVSPDDPRAAHCDFAIQLKRVAD